MLKKYALYDHVKEENVLRPVILFKNYKSARVWF